MKSTYKQKPKQAEWPKTMIADKGLIVLFQARGCGVVLYNSTDESYQIGYHSNGWCMEEFKDFHGTITIDVE